MNAGTFTQALNVSGYRTAASGVSGTKGKTADSPGFMDVFSQNLKDSSKTGTKAVSGKQDGAAGSKAQDQESIRDNPLSADQGGKTGLRENEKFRGDDKTSDSGTEKTEEDSKAGSQQNNGLTQEEAMSFQAMMALWQEMPDSSRMEEVSVVPDIIAPDTVLQTETAAGAVNSEQAVPVIPETTGHEQQAELQFRGQVSTGEAEAVRGQMTQEETGRPMAKQDGAVKTLDFGRSEETDARSADMAASVRAGSDEAQSGEEMFSGMGGRRSEALNVVREQAQTAGDDSEDVNQVLEELKRNADAKGLDLTDKAVQNKMNYSLRPVSGAGEQQMETPVLEQLKTGFERAVKTGAEELTIRLKPEGLGDMVVHLTSTGDKVTVRIGVTNPETEKLVTSQMESLKEMLRPLNAEVQEVYHSSQNAMDFSGFGRQMPERRGHQNQSGYSFHGTQDSGSDEELLAQAGRMMAESRMSRLYAYI